LLRPERVAAWIELHIEQGRCWLRASCRSGSSRAFAATFGIASWNVSVRAGHSGAVPRWLRRDAVFATAELITHLDRHWRTLLERGRDLVVTSGVMGTDSSEHAIARIPGLLRLSFEARSQSQETLEAFYDLFVSECASIGEERGVEFRFDRRLQSAPAVMDPGWVEKLRAAARSLGLPDEPIQAELAHDAAVFANAGIPSAMILCATKMARITPTRICKYLISWQVCVMKQVLREAIQ